MNYILTSFFLICSLSAFSQVEFKETNFGATFLEEVKTGGNKTLILQKSEIKKCIDGSFLIKNEECLVEDVFYELSSILQELSEAKKRLYFYETSIAEIKSDLSEDCVEVKFIEITRCEN